jgi:3-oxoacyl-[acyl-carrier protein] reductase
VIVTGAARGIGAATTARLRTDGWTAIATDILAGPDIEVCDVTSTEQVVGLVSKVISSQGQIDGLVNAAGMGKPATFLEATDETWFRHFDINVMGTVRMSRAVIPHLKASAYPARGIVNFTSQAAKTGGILIGAPYSAAKAAVLCLTKTMAAEFGPAGLRVNAVAPGIVDTAFLDGVPGIRDRGPQLPLRRIGRPEEVASVVAFLLSEDASYLTGEIVDVNGGLLMD